MGTKPDGRGGWWLPAVVAFGAGGITIAIAEVVGIIRGRDIAQVDTISDAWWWLGDTVPEARVPMAVGLGGFLVWLFHHLTFGGQPHDDGGEG